jgi:hypothetical protein
MDLKAMGNLRALITAAIVVWAGGKFAMAQAYQQTNLVYRTFRDSLRIHPAGRQIPNC